MESTDLEERQMRMGHEFGDDEKVEKNSGGGGGIVGSL